MTTNKADLIDFEQRLRWQASGKAARAEAHHATKRGQYNPTPWIRVLLTVRGPHGGPVQYFEHYERTVSPLQAECEARKAARAAGLRVWAHLSTEVVSPD